MKRAESLFLKLEELTRGGPQFLRREIFELKTWLGSSRGARPQGYMSRPKVRAAYLAYYLPLHLPEVYWILSQRDFVKAALDRRKSADDFRIADLGAGPGTASLSLLLWAKSLKIDTKSWSFDLFDQSIQALDSGQELLKSIDEDVRAQGFREDLRRPLRTKKQYDFILMSHLLNEWGNGPRYLDRKKALLEEAFKALKDEGFLLIVDPPLRESSMDLMSLRDFLANEVPQFQILQPCPQGTLFCPMKKARLGWCYAQPPRTWARERELALWDKALERILDKDLDRPGFSYLLLKKSEKTQKTSKHQISIADERHRDGLRCTDRGIKKGKGSYRGAYID